MSDVEEPRFAFRVDLNFSRIATTVNVEDPTLIPDKKLDEAWNLLSDFVIDMLDEMGEEVTDERYREIFLEVCYRLVWREMQTLFYLPRRDESWKERLGTNQRGPSRRARGPYDDSYSLKGE